jgi:hypothetical protein
MSYYIEDVRGEIPRFVVTVSAPDVISGIERVERELSIAEVILTDCVRTVKRLTKWIVTAFLRRTG